MKDFAQRGSRIIILLIPLFVIGLLASDDPLKDNYDEPDTQQQYISPDQLIEPPHVDVIDQIPGDVIDGGGSEWVEANPDLTVEQFRTDDGRRGWKAQLQQTLPLATPAVSYNQVYIGGGFGSYEFYSFDAETGKPLWLFHCGDDGPTAAVVEKGCVAFNTESCILYVLDAETGEQLWGKWLGDPLMSQPAISGDRIVMAYPGSQIYEEQYLEDDSYIEDEYIEEPGYAYQYYHAISCMELRTGKEFWTQPIPGEIISAPIIADGKVYCSTLEGSVHCFDLETGEKLFSYQHQATSAPWIWEGELYVSLREDEERMVDGERVTIRNEGQARIRSDGERDNRTLWAKQEAIYLNVDRTSAYAAEQMELDASVGFGSAPAAAKLGQSEENLGVFSVSGVWAYQGSRPAIIRDRSYTAMGDTLKMLDAESGDVLWSRHIEVKNSPGGRPLSPPAYANGRLYLGSVTGELICIDAGTGREEWRYDCGEPIRFQPAVASGRIYWGTDNGTVYCLEAKDPNADGWLMWGGNAQHNYYQTD